jgi:hypothetical protein
MLMNVALGSTSALKLNRVKVRPPPDFRRSPIALAGGELQAADKSLWGKRPVGRACFPYAAQSGFLGSGSTLGKQLKAYTLW